MADSFENRFPDPDSPSRDLVTPSPARDAIPEIMASIRETIRLLRARRVHHPGHNRGRAIHFADGSSARVYRETRIDDGHAGAPVVLVVGFVLRYIRGPAHWAFRVESWLNIPLFVGFPGFTSKLWMTHDQQGCYRGLYEWDGAAQAWTYARGLSWILGLVSVPGTVRAHVVPGVRRDEVLGRPEQFDVLPDQHQQWWRPVRPPGRPKQGEEPRPC